MSAQHGIGLVLHIGQRVRYQDYKGERVIGTVRALAIEDQALMATIGLDRPIVVPAGHGYRSIDIHTQHVPAHELVPFDDRDELMAKMLAALIALTTPPHDAAIATNYANARAVIAKATGAASS